MSVEILINKKNTKAILYNTETGQALGCVIENSDGYSAEDVANVFIDSWDEIIKELPFEKSPIRKIEEASDPLFKYAYDKFIGQIWPNWVNERENERKEFLHSHSGQTEKGCYGMQ